MKEPHDEKILSAYIDGELDTAAMQQVETIIENNAEASKYVLGALKTTARLRADMQPVMNEEIPDRLLSVFEKQETRKIRKRSVFLNLGRAAAAVLLVVFGFVAADQIDRYKSVGIPKYISSMPWIYSDVVNQALENNLSGTTRQLQGQGSGATIQVTPVKTYRDQGGVYYREYRFEATGGDQEVMLNGLAYRTSKGNWETKALFF